MLLKLYTILVYPLACVGRNMCAVFVEVREQVVVWFFLSTIWISGNRTHVFRLTWQTSLPLRHLDAPPHQITLLTIYFLLLDIYFLLLYITHNSTLNNFWTHNPFLNLSYLLIIELKLILKSCKIDLLRTHFHFFPIAFMVWKYLTLFFCYCEIIWCFCCI